MNIVTTSLLVALLASAVVLPAQELPPAPVPEPVPAEAPAIPSPVSPGEAVAPEPPAAPEAPPAPTPPVEQDASAPPRSQPSAPREIFVLGSDALLPAGDRAREVISVLGNVIVDGFAQGDTVAILGDLTVNGESREAVAVLGNVTINGRVNGDVVAVLGGVQLGPAAIVTGEVVSIGGGIDRAPGAVVHRGVNQIGFGGAKLPALDGFKTWIRNCLVLGRPLALVDGLGWAWAIAGGFLAFYLLLSLVFGRAVETCAETLEKRPGLTLLTSLLTMLLLPVLTLLLAVTGIGPFLLALAAMAGTLFGKAALLMWMGRRITLPLGVSVPVFATLIGGAVLTGVYLIPYVGFVMWKASGVLGLGLVVYTVILAMQRERAARPVPPPIPAASPFTAGPMAAVDPAGGYTPVQGLTGTVPTHQAGPPPVVPAALLSSATLPRAGFWIRLGAAALDLVLIGMIASLLGIVFVPLFAIYCFTLWAMKGTTIGGIICGLKVVRLDDRPMDWKVAMVRCLASFLSLVVAGFGFIWVAFDEERQSWHDKIAGTTIVRVPKAVSLI